MSDRVQIASDKFKQHIDARIASYFSSCVHCGICAEACLFYTETGDPRYTPIHKLEPMRKIWRQEFTFWGKLASKLGFSKPLTEAELAEWEELVYDSCTLCARCSMVCPVGNDLVYMIRKEREGMAAAGYAPEGLKEATRRSLEIGSPMGVTLKTFQVTLKNVEQETGLTLPVDVEGADYMMLHSSAEIVEFPETLAAVARIFERAGLSWTYCSEAFEGTNSGIQIGDSEAAAKIVERIVRGAEKLKVKYVVSPECGHAYTALRWEGPNLIGRAYPFQVIHILELLDQLRAEGRLKTRRADAERLTFHDPCQLVRRGGLLEEPRHLLDMVAENFVEMPDHREMNWCCGGGGGVSANERADALRNRVFQRKKRQLEAIDVHTIVTACTNCRNMLEDGLDNYNMDLEVVGVSETLANYLEEDGQTGDPGKRQ
jgi:Fe-S oxidoreductase